MRGEERGLNFAPLLITRKKIQPSTKLHIQAGRVPQRTAAPEAMASRIAIRHRQSRIDRSRSPTEHRKAGEAGRAQPSFNSSLSGSKEALFGTALPEFLISVQT